MTDNTKINQGLDGDDIATDDIDGIKHQRVKMEFGEDGEATEVSPTNPLPIIARSEASLLEEILAELKTLNFRMSLITS